MKKPIHLIFLTLILFASALLKSQVNYSYIFTADSLKGFNENTAKQIALQNNCFGEEFKTVMYFQKREFVNHKYGIGDDHSHALSRMAPFVAPAIINPACTNVGFEDGTFSGWEIFNGTNVNSVTMGGCCPIPGVIISSVIPGAGSDPLVPALSLVSPFGDNIAQLNNWAGGAKVERINQTFWVTSSNAIFQIAFSGVLDGSGAHNCNTQPYMNISVIDSSGKVIDCPKIDIQAPSAACVADASVTAGWVDAGGGKYWHDWEIKTLDLSKFIGSFMTIQITVGDCTAGGHGGYGYFDCKCLPLEAVADGSFADGVYDLSAAVTNLSLCGGSSVTVSVPDGLDNYKWDGPPGSGISGVLTRTVALSFPGEYTLTINPPGICDFPISKLLVLTDSPDYTLDHIDTAPTCTNAVGATTIIPIGGTPVFSYKWTPAVSFSESAGGLTPGTDYTVKVSDGYGCQHTITVNVPPFPGAPIYTINPLSGIITCITSSLSLTSVTGTNTTGGWMPSLTPTITVSTPGTYTCLLTNTITGCKAYVPVPIKANQALPTATPNVNCGASTTTLNASAAAGVALGWLAPTLPSPTNLGNPSTSTVVGTFTLTATDLATGCKQTYTVANTPPTITLTAAPLTKTITCYEPTIFLTASSNAVGFVTQWDDGKSTSSDNPFGAISAGTYTATIITSGGCTAKQTIQVYADIAVDAMITTPSTVISCATGSVELSVSSTTVGGGPYSYYWAPSTPTYTGNPFVVNLPGTYTVMAVNARNGCSVTVTQEIGIERLDADFMPDPIWGIVPLPVNFNNNSFNGVTYNWDLGNGVSSDSFTTSTVYNSAGTYTIILTTINGFCKDTAMRIVRVELISSLEIPNVFTPNGDGSNDLFKLKAINMGEINMTIYDRWGAKMYEHGNFGSMAWDGVNKGGHLVTDGTYFYVVKATGLDNKKYDMKGNITVFTNK